MSHQIDVNTLRALREPPNCVTDAMAMQVAAAKRRNGHGEHGYRDMWQAAIDALLREVSQ